MKRKILVSEKVMSEINELPPEAQEALLTALRELATCENPLALGEAVEQEDLEKIADMMKKDTGPIMELDIEEN